MIRNISSATRCDIMHQSITNSTTFAALYVACFLHFQSFTYCCRHYRNHELAHSRTKQTNDTAHAVLKIAVVVDLDPVAYLTTKLVACPAFHLTNFSWSQPMISVKTRRKTRWNLQGCLKLPDRSQPLVCRSAPYYGDMWKTYCCLTTFFRLSICALVAKI